MYRAIKQRPYTRREFMGGVPGARIIQYHSGNKTGQFPVEVSLIPEERSQIRHTALEALRITAVRFMDKKAGRDNYHLHVRVYPHHVLRQNKQASGAGADRVSMGMRLAFGKPIGTAARVEVGQPIITIRTYARAVDFAKEALRKCMNKVATPCHFDIRTSDGRSVDEVLAIAASRAGRALSGAGTITEEAEAEELGVDVEDLPEELRDAPEGSETDAGSDETAEASDAEAAQDATEREGQD